MSGFWRLAFRNLLRNRRRNVATVAAVSFGYAGILLMAGFVGHSETILRLGTVYLQHVGHLALFKGDSCDVSETRPQQYSLSADEQRIIGEVLRLTPEVEFSGRYLRTTGLVGNGCRSVPFVGRGVDDAAERRIRGNATIRAMLGASASLVAGRGAWEPGVPANAVTLSRGVARLLGKSNLRFSGDASSPVTFPDCADAGSAKILANDTNVQLAGTTFSGSFSAVDAEISGFYDASNDDANTVELLASTTLLQQLLDTDAVTYVAAFLKNTDDIEGQARRLQKRLRDEGVAVSVLTFRDDRVNEFYTGTMDFLNSIVLFVGLVVSMVIVLSIVNSMTMSVIERSREIGSLRALGFRRADILGIFVREAALLGFAGVLLGLFVAYTLALGVNAMGWSFHPPALASRVPFMLVPRVSQAIGLAVVLFALVLVGARIAVRRKVCQNIVSLLTHTAG